MSAVLVNSLRFINNSLLFCRKLRRDLMRRNKVTIAWIKPFLEIFDENRHWLNEGRDAMSGQHCRSASTSGDTANKHALFGERQLTNVDREVIKKCSVKKILLNV